MSRPRAPVQLPGRRARRGIVVGLTAAAVAAVALALAGHWSVAPLTARIVPLPTTTNASDSTAPFDHAAFDQVLARFVDARGLVDYRGLAADRQALDEYAAQLAAASPRSHPTRFPTLAHCMVYWINAYNALIILAVIDHYPVDSVTAILPDFGVFRRVTFTVGGEQLSLDAIEKGILLREFDEPRVHFALTCASMSCPRLDQRAFVAEGLDARLDAEGRAFLATSDGVRLDLVGQQVRLSPYFDWYGKDFGSDHRAFVARYLTPARQAELAQLREAPIAYFDYDWRLNDQAAAWAPR